jgi:hypothetical protein
MVMRPSALTGVFSLILSIVKKHKKGTALAEKIETVRNNAGTFGEFWALT